MPRQRSGGVEAKLYDFRRPLTLAREQSRRLEMAFERFARMWGTQLTSRLRVPYTVVADQLVLRTYDEYVSTLPSPTLMVLCQV
ncbi:MAG: flagellar motor switch protein FliM, partial [Cellulomonas sp.]|nr:flagellar motor switch protein FliM [Cellulomonas sp.]